MRHGLTVGELARLYNDERHIGCDLRVIRMENWQRVMWFDATGQTWVNPSPNMRSLTEAALYPGVALLMGIESASIPLPSEIIMPFSGYLVYTGRFSLWGVSVAGAAGCVFGSIIAYWPACMEAAPSSSDTDVTS